MVPNSKRGGIIISDAACMVWFVGFTSQSTVMVMSRRTVHLPTLLTWASLTKRITITSRTYFHL